MTLSDRLARFNRWLPNRIVRTFAGRRLSPVAIVVHRGRRSGRHYRTPVLAFRVDDGYVIALFYGTDRDWVRNVLAAGSCSLERGGRRVELTDPRMLDAGDDKALVPAPMRPGPATAACDPSPAALGGLAARPLRRVSRVSHCTR